MSRLLIITQKIDRTDDLLGFMHGWITEFARQSPLVTAVGLSVGKYDLPSNVRVFSLGKEHHVSRLRYVYNLYRIIWRERSKYDAVFVHMNEVYVLLGAIVWRIMGKKVSLWYAHGSVSTSLRIATFLVHIIFTSTESGFRIKTSKKKVVGQAIDIERFSPSGFPKNKLFTLITVGRISPSKDLETLVRAVSILAKKGKIVRVVIVGKPALSSDADYYAKIKMLIKELSLENSFDFIGSVANDEIVPHLRQSDLFVNMGKTGSLDKAILEAMATSLPILTCNEALYEVLGEYADELIYHKNDSQALAERITSIMDLSDEERQLLGGSLREIVVKHHSLRSFVGKILSLI